MRIFRQLFFKKVKDLTFEIKNPDIIRENKLVRSVADSASRRFFATFFAPSKKVVQKQLRKE